MNLGCRLLRGVHCNIGHSGYLKGVERLLSFESSLSLKNLYPTSNLSITTPAQQVPVKPGEKFNGFVPLDKLQISYSRSSGAGGQHVNKVNTKAEIRFHLDEAAWIPEEIRLKMKEQFKNRLTSEGFFIIVSEKTRSQQLNLADCLDRLRHIIRESETPEEKPPSPEETALKIKRQEKANRERLKEKAMRSLTKYYRSNKNLL